MFPLHPTLALPDHEVRLLRTIMKLLLIFILALGCIAAVVTNKSSAFSSQDIPKESKVQPKQVILAKDTQSDKYGEVAFNHETHTTKKYSPKRAAVLPCT